MKAAAESQMIRMRFRICACVDGGCDGAGDARALMPPMGPPTEPMALVEPKLPSAVTVAPAGGISARFTLGTAMFA